MLLSGYWKGTKEYEKLPSDEETENLTEANENLETNEQKTPVDEETANHDTTLPHDAHRNRDSLITNYAKNICEDAINCVEKGKCDPNCERTVKSYATDIDSKTLAHDTLDSNGSSKLYNVAATPHSTKDPDPSGCNESPGSYESSGIHESPSICDLPGIYESAKVYDADDTHSAMGNHDATHKSHIPIVTTAYSARETQDRRNIHVEKENIEASHIPVVSVTNDPREIQDPRNIHVENEYIEASHIPVVSVTNDSRQIQDTRDIHNKGDSQEAIQVHDKTVLSHDVINKSLDAELREKSLESLEGSQLDDGEESLKLQLENSLELSDETFERIERLCNESSAIISETRSVLEGPPIKTSAKKQVTWESNVKDNSVNDNIVNEERILERDRNLNKANHNSVLGSPDIDSSNQKATGAAWDIAVGDFSKSKKPSKRAEALRSARHQTFGEPYIPPKVLASVSQIAQRKVLDLKRW